MKSIARAMQDISLTNNRIAGKSLWNAAFKVGFKVLGYKSGPIDVDWYRAVHPEWPLKVRFKLRAGASRRFDDGIIPLRRINIC